MNLRRWNFLELMKKDTPITILTGGRKNRVTLESYVNLLQENKKLTTEKEQLNSLVNSCQEEIRILKNRLKEASDYVKKRNFDKAEILLDVGSEYCYDDDFEDGLLYILEKGDK